MSNTHSIKQAQIWGAVTAVLLAGILFFFFRNAFFKSENQSSLNTINFGTATAGNEYPDAAASLPPGEVLTDGDTYKDPLGFSFVYPKNWVVGTFPEGEDGSIVIVQNPERSVGFQVYTSPFNEEDTTLTPERLLREIPDLVIKEPGQINIADGGTGITFMSDNGSGKTREVWFIHTGYLYQISAPISAQGILQEVLKTWAF